MVPNIVGHLTSFATATVNCLGQGSSSGGSCDTGLPKVALESNTLQIILQLVFGVIGGIALITMIVAAIQFTLSSGEPQEVEKARDTLIYAAVGLLVALLAEVLVTFILNNV